jgi:hypothetical protein
VVVVVEVQEDDHFPFNHIDNYPIANVGAEHAGQVMAQPLTNSWIITDLGELFIDAISQNMIFLGKAMKALLKSRGKA